MGPSIPPKIDWPWIKVERSSQRGVKQGTDAGVVAGDAETQGGSAVANVEPLVWLADFQARLHLILNRMCFRPEPRRRWLRDATRAATDLQRVNGVSCGSSREMAPGRLASMWVLSVLHRQRAGSMRGRAIRRARHAPAPMTAATASVDASSFASFLGPSLMALASTRLRPHRRVFPASGVRPAITGAPARANPRIFVFRRFGRS